MSASSPTSVPADRGKPLEFDKWIWVDEHDELLQRRWLAVMYQMDASYRAEDVHTFKGWICRRRYMGVRAYYYAGQDFELALRLDYVPGRRMYRVLSAGFAGSISPREALDLLIEQSIRHGTIPEIRALKIDAEPDRIVAIQPKRMDDAGILELYRELQLHPRLKINVEFETDDAICLVIACPDLENRAGM